MTTTVGKISIHNDDLHDTVHISPSLWDQLRLKDDSALLLQPKFGSPRTSIRSALVCNAVYTPSVEEISSPRSWLEKYQSLKHAAANLHCFTIRSIIPTPLFELVLVALSTSAYHVAETSPADIQRELAANRRILRQHDIVNIASPSHLPGGSSPQSQRYDFQYQVVMLQPVAQGYVMEGKTKIIVIPDQPLEEPVEPNPFNLNEHLSSSEDGNSEINENFLIHSILGQLGTETSLTRSIMAEDFGDHPPVNTKFLAQPLTMDFIDSTDHDACADQDGFVRTAELARAGIFSGDWVIVSSRNTPSSARLLRLHANDVIAARPQSSILISPILIHNLTKDSGEKVPEISIQSCPFGQRTPPIPTAQSITVVRVASPVTTQRKYQPIVLRALRKYFEGKRRLLVKGDLIAVAVDASKSSIFEDGLDRVEVKTKQESLDEIIDLTITGHVVSNAVAYFRVVNVEHKIARAPQESSKPDSHFAALMGELGCWMDPSFTRLVQTGVENAFVPDVDSFLGIKANVSRTSLVGEATPLTRFGSPFHKMHNICRAALHPSASDYGLSITILLKGARGSGKLTTTHWVARSLGLHVLAVNCYDIMEETDVKTEGVLKARFEHAAECCPSVLLLQNIDALARSSQKMETGKESPIAPILEECISGLKDTWKRTGMPVFVIATTTEADRVPLSVQSCFKHNISIEAPDEEERLQILRELLSDSPLALDVKIESIATQTAGLVASDLVDLIVRVQTAAADRITDASRSLELPEDDLLMAGYDLTCTDFEIALSGARSAFSTSIGAPSIPKVTWDDVGGLASIKSDILDTVQLPLQHPELFSQGMKKRSGVLLYGPPGTGKTLVAKAVATSCALNFFSVKGPELLNMYIGESEANVRRVFQRARDARPCVIFFDELDSVAPKRGNHGDSGGVMDRIVSQLLAELDGMSSGGSTDVFVIGATNRPDLLDPALLRPGRFDKLLYLGVSDTRDAQLKILEALTRKFRLHPDLNLRSVAEQCPFNYTGADFYALCSDAMLKAMTRKASEVDIKIAALNSQPPQEDHPYPITPQYYLAKMAADGETDVVVTLEDFGNALQELVPSVSQSEMEHYRSVQARFTKGVDKNHEALTNDEFRTLIAQSSD